MITIKKRVSWVCDLIILWSLTLLVFLIPIFFLPFNPRTIEFSKQLLLFVLILTACLAWFGKGIINRRLTVRRTPLDIPILCFLIIYALATVFSVDRVSSILGSYGQGSEGLIVTIFYALLYFILVSNINNTRKLIQIGLALVASLFVVITYVFLQLFNIFILPFDFAKMNSFNPVGSIASLVVFLAFVMNIVVAFLLKTKMKLIWRILLLILLLANLLLLNTINFNLGWYLLIVSMFIILGFGIASNKEFIAKKWLVVPGALLVISIFAATLGIPSIIKGNLPSEVSLGRQISWQITRQTLWSGFFKFIFGSGPETFGYDFSQYRPANFNDNALWNIRFEKANNHYLEMIATTGSLGMLAYVVIILIAVGSSSLILVEGRRKKSTFLQKLRQDGQLSGGVMTKFQTEQKARPEKQNLNSSAPAMFPAQNKKIAISSPSSEEVKTETETSWPEIKKDFSSPQSIVNLKSHRAEDEEEEEEEEETSFSQSYKPYSYFAVLGVTAGWVSLLLAYFLTSVNTVTQMLFWLSLGLVMDLIIVCRPQEIKKIKLSFKASPKYALLLSFTFVIALSAVTILFTYLGRIYLADIYHQKGLEKSQTQKYEEASLYFAQAIKLNKYQPLYPLSLAQNYLVQANLEAAKGSEANLENIRLLIANSINESKQATDLVPRNVNFWEARGQIYENTTLYSQDANAWVINSYEKARELEPTNPIFETKLGRAYLVNASLVEGENQTSNYNQAMDVLKKATELKPDYLAAHYYLSLIYEKQEKLQEALQEIAICYQIAPQNQEIIFELGRLSYNKAVAESPKDLKENVDFQRAIEAFNLVVSLNPQNANAHYSLGLAYETLGENQKALEEMKTVKDLNPDNKQIQEKVDSLEAQVAGTSTKKAPEATPEILPAETEAAPVTPSDQPSAEPEPQIP